jgi:hypothetical protein
MLMSQMDVMTVECRTVCVRYEMKRCVCGVVGVGVVIGVSYNFFIQQSAPSCCSNGWNDSCVSLVGSLGWRLQNW